MSHWDLVDERCLGVLKTTLEILGADDVPFTLGGGWAVYSYAPSVPSVDTDIFLHEPLPNSVIRQLGAKGISVGHMKEVEPLDVRTGWLLGIR